LPPTPPIFGLFFFFFWEQPQFTNKTHQAPDNSWDYRPLTQEEADIQYRYQVFHNGVYVPHPHLIEGTEMHEKLQEASTKPVKKTMTKPKLEPRQTAKRKAEENLDGQSPQKKSNLDSHADMANDAGDESALEPVLHSQGILSAEPPLNPDESSPSTPGEATPAPELEPVQEEEKNEQDMVPPEEREPPIPKSAGDVDAYGVRIVRRKKAGLGESKVRIMAPPNYEFDPVEIGYRDSTNDSTRNGTLARRGKFLDKPGTNAFFYDPWVWGHDATSTKAGELDAKLVEKHNVHPFYGLFLTDSVNESEPNTPHKSGQNPIVHLTPDGRILHTSRSILHDRVERRLDEAPLRSKLKVLVNAHCEENDIPLDDLQPDEYEELRQYAHARRVAAESDAMTSPSEVDSETSFFPADDSTLNAEGINILLNAAQVSQAMDRSSVPPPTPKQTSRPYDAIRDVFSEPAPPPPPVNQEPDNFKLSLLATVSDSQPRSSFSDSTNGFGYQPRHPEQSFSYTEPPLVDSRGVQISVGPMESSMDPRYAPQGPSEASIPSMQPGSSIAPLSFLQTALNQPQAYNTHPPAPLYGAPLNQPPPHPQALQPAVSMSRMPFSNPNPNNTSKGSPALPPLRPPRKQVQEHLEESPIDPNMAQRQQNLVSSNSGSFYPPGPARPYHNSFTSPEQPHGLLPGPPLIPQPAQSIAPNSGPYAPSGMSAQYPHQGPPLPHVAQSPPLPGAGTIMTSPLGHGSPSSAAQAKYRTLYPAPIKHRQGAPANGPELRTVPFDPREGIKDYHALEPPPGGRSQFVKEWKDYKKPRTTKTRSTSQEKDSSK
jgi:hypothetical protein